ncbi:hypothetical protein M569_05880 [Genlisea aurea]|uniref:Retrotransposon gag domain-containing protein n=1 Tax=Genlisea aurea TaxID=192259 RepID=S8CP32_9LAMI|nr:hypothetical protein M569_05880 [Genlisea aurea]
MGYLCTATRTRERNHLRATIHRTRNSVRGGFVPESGVEATLWQKAAEQEIAAAAELTKEKFFNTNFKFYERVNHWTKLGIRGGLSGDRGRGRQHRSIEGCVVGYVHLEESSSSKWMQTRSKTRKGEFLFFPEVSKNRILLRAGTSGASTSGREQVLAGSENDHRTGRGQEPDFRIEPITQRLEDAIRSSESEEIDEEIEIEREEMNANPFNPGGVPPGGQHQDDGNHGNVENGADFYNNAGGQQQPPRMTMREGNMFYEHENAFGTPYEMRGCELKAGMLNNLPKFHGRAGEDPHKHIKEFQVICSTMKSEGNNEEQVMLQAFPFSLMDGAKDWFFNLESGSIDNWLAMKRAFFERYFPATQVGYARKELCSIRQQTGETLHEYWERFKKQLASCPNHQLPPLLLMQFFYQGLFDMERMMIDASCGGCFLNKTPEEAKDLITMVANNAQQYGFRDRGAKVVNAASATMNGMEQRMDNLTDMMSKLVDKVSNKVVCAICCTEGHDSAGCPLLQSTEDDGRNMETVNALAGQVNPKNNPYSSHYNPGWRI